MREEGRKRDNYCVYYLGFGFLILLFFRLGGRDMNMKEISLFGGI